MGCGGSKNSKGAKHAVTASGSAAARAHYPPLDTPEEQSKRFLQLCNPQQYSAETGQVPSPSPNPLAVELKRVYTETRQRVLEQKLDDEEATLLKQEHEREARRCRVHGRHFKQNSGAMRSPIQREFLAYVNDSVAQAKQRRFSAYSAVEAVELFAGYVKHDLQMEQRKALEEKGSKPGSRRGSLSPAIVTTARTTAGVHPAATPSVGWACRMQCTISGDSSTADSLLEEARQRWVREREASRRKPASPADSRELREKARGGNGKHREKTKPEERAAAVTSVLEPVQRSSSSSSTPAEGSNINADGGQGLLFIDAVFETAVPGSFHRRTPWQLEILFYFAAQP
ncbi:hypothetical protein ABL78_2862 [Leptomonas seymouri]|uniref:Uncharacterized protein n=1 Tax=Leptomonas seymouri TaxID=5684 RepID=A0A0N0P6U4_LEPSE|nr:hypothetical protein ABL78_2862 [Leptomonas seymouri]|eukprot:KPI88036.1 hypothetical protein ABL78_2862 [Leptomonas seymouri]